MFQESNLDLSSRHRPPCAIDDTNLRLATICERDLMVYLSKFKPNYSSAYMGIMIVTTSFLSSDQHGYRRE